MNYTRPNWTSSITYWNGTTELFHHCGRCLCIMPEGLCAHCASAEEKKEASLLKLAAYKQSHKEEDYADLR